MTSFNFPQCEYELFWKYYGRLHDFLAHYGYCLEKWEILNIVYEGVTSETRALLEHWDFCVRNVDEAWELLELLARDTYKFETSHFNPSTPPPASLIIRLLRVRFAIVLTMTVILVPTIFLLMVLLGLLV